MSRKKFNKTEFFERLDNVRAYYRLNQSEMAERLSITSAFYSDMKHRGTGPSVQVVYGVYTQFVEINIGWLLTGVGSMLVVDQKIAETQLPYGDQRVDAFAEFVRRVDLKYDESTKKALASIMQGLLDLL